VVPPLWGRGRKFVVVPIMLTTLLKMNDLQKILIRKLDHAHAHTMLTEIKLLTIFLQTLMLIVGV
jgi:hypothetical protein